MRKVILILMLAAIALAASVVLGGCMKPIGRGDIYVM
jgi:hypothetical protein